jgi:hypothetical protein
VTGVVIVIVIIVVLVGGGVIPCGGDSEDAKGQDDTMEEYANPTAAPDEERGEN